MKIDLKVNNKIIGQLSISQEDYDCVTFGGTNVTEYIHISNDDGELLYFFTNEKGKDETTIEAKDNKPLMNHVPKFEDDGITNVKEYLLTVEKWICENHLLKGLSDDKALSKAQRLLNHKIKNCKKRMRKG